MKDEPSHDANESEAIARSAIAEGIAQMEAGEAIPAEQAFAEIRKRLGFPPRNDSSNDKKR